MEYEDPSPNSEDSAYLTPPMVLLSIGAIKEITGVSRTMMFSDGYSERPSPAVEGDDTVTRSFHDMAVRFPRLEEFGVRGPTEVGQQWQIVVSTTD